MQGIGASVDTGEFEVAAEFDAHGDLTTDVTHRVCACIDEHGFAVISGLFRPAEAAAALTLVRDAIDDQHRETGAFASETDTRYRRRDFCPLPSTDAVLDVCADLVGRARHVLAEYAGATRPILEISTLTSYFGSSHQYLHRDPGGVICMFLALDDVSPEQGGTVFVPGTHPFSGSGRRHGGRAGLLMRLYETQVNVRVFRHNLTKLLRMKRSASALAPGEFRERVLSRTAVDNHQPNIPRFLLARNPVFGRSHVGLRTIVRLFQHGRSAREAHRLVQVCPRRGDVIVYRSDVLHAGPDNCSDAPRYFLNINIARDVIHPDRRREGYSPHSTLAQDPLTLRQLQDRSVRPSAGTPTAGTSTVS